MAVRPVALGLLRSCHPLPTAAVTVLTLLLVLAARGTWGRGTAVVAAVLTGQLVIGWSNDLVDLERDRAVGRADKPLAQGEVSFRAVRNALRVATALTVLLSLAASVLTAVLHLVLVVGSGLAYNFWLKATVWSWVPYAVAFGALPVVVWVAVGPGAPAGWVVAVGALLGVGAHLLNALPDLGDDERTGVRGLPHRLGPRLTRFLAPLLLLGGSVVVAFVPEGAPHAWSYAVLAGCAALAVVAWTARGKAPFIAAIGMAVGNVLALVAVGA